LVIAGAIHLPQAHERQLRGAEPALELRNVVSWANAPTEVEAGHTPITQPLEGRGPIVTLLSDPALGSGWDRWRA
jgi:hypothetical protein